MLLRDGAALVEVARASIGEGLHRGKPHLPDVGGCAPALREPGATFVTLHREGELRGCVGTLIASRPLVHDVAHNAFGAAFRDPRFPPLGDGELGGLDIGISLLSTPERLPAASEEELLASLRPGIDGLILEEGGRRATFLPAVWKSLPEPRRFAAELKRKAGLPCDYWSPTLRAWRYTAERVGGGRAAG